MFSCSGERLMRQKTGIYKFVNKVNFVSASKISWRLEKGMSHVCIELWMSIMKNITARFV